MASANDCYIYDTVIDGTHRCFAALLPPDAGSVSGLPCEAIMGEFTQGTQALTPDAFKQNPVFIQFVANTISKHAAACPGLIAEARRQQNGCVYILDLRTRDPDADVPPEDIIGYVIVENGQMLRFHSSPNYRILTNQGFPQLDEWFRQRLIDDLSLIATSDDLERQA